LKRELLDALIEDRAARRTAVLLTWLESGEQQLVYAADELEAQSPSSLGDAVRRALGTDRAEQVETDRGAVFVHPYNPPLRLAIVGAVHIGQHLAALAQRTGYAVTVIDPRTAFASEARFPGTALSHEWPDRALDAHGLDSRTAVVTLTHDPKLDDPALLAALESPVFYIGSLGSKRTHARRLERLREHGVSQQAAARIHGPVGLSIGARSPAEIAVSILAEITQALRSRAS